jgi:glycosyltransferase involved in cell wall biosynthesis
MLRVKNEELNIVESIESIIDLSSEVVVVDNNSTDKTVELVSQMICNHAGGHKIKIYHYPFQGGTLWGGSRRYPRELRT